MASAFRQPFCLSAITLRVDYRRIEFKLLHSFGFRHIHLTAGSNVLWVNKTEIICKECLTIIYKLRLNLMNGCIDMCIENERLLLAHCVLAIACWIRHRHHHYHHLYHRYSPTAVVITWLVTDTFRS